MRRVATLSILTLSAGLVAGCDLKEVYPTNVQPMAGVRFINAVPDTAGAYGMDMRFVDYLESNAHFRQNFRNGPAATGCTISATCPVPDQHFGSPGVQYKHARAGARNFKIFLDDTLASWASIEIIDTTFTFVAGQNYTVLAWGYANPTGPGRPVGAPPLQVLIYQEAVVAPPAGQVSVRVLNATTGAVDVQMYNNGGVPGGNTFANVLPMSFSGYVDTPAAEKRFNFQPAGGGAALFADAMALEGDTAFSTAGGLGLKDIEAIPGTRAPGSAVTVILWPASIAGTRTPVTTTPHNFTIRNMTSVWDRRPPYVQ